MKKIVLGLCLALFAPWASSDGWVELDPPRDRADSEQIEVLEFFWYGCPHCYRFEPWLQQWHEEAAEDVVLTRVPAASSEAWLAHARAYYTALTMGILEDHHQALYDAIHQYKQRLSNEKELRKFFVDRGVDGEQYQRVHDSEEVDQLTKRAYLMGRDYRIRGVPALIVNGRFMTSPTTAGGAEQAIDVLRQLVERERDRLARQ